MYRQVILLVEDTPEELEPILRALMPAHCSVQRVRDAAEALPRLAGPGPQPAMILLNLERDALGALRRIRAEPAAVGLPVVIMTGPKEARAIAEGAGLSNSCVEKPAERGALTEVVRLVAEYWLKLNVSPGSLTGF